MNAQLNGRVELSVQREVSADDLERESFRVMVERNDEFLNVTGDRSGMIFGCVVMVCLAFPLGFPTLGGIALGTAGTLAAKLVYLFFAASRAAYEHDAIASLNERMHGKK